MFFFRTYQFGMTICPAKFSIKDDLADIVTAVIFLSNILCHAFSIYSCLTVQNYSRLFLKTTSNTKPTYKIKITEPARVTWNALELVCNSIRRKIYAEAMIIFLTFFNCLYTEDLMFILRLMNRVKLRHVMCVMLRLMNRVKLRHYIASL